MDVKQLERSLKDISTTFTVDDVESINALGNPTTKARQFLDFCRPHMTSELHCFWAGRQGKLKARESKEYKSDADVPFVSALFALCTALKDQGNPQSVVKLFAFAVSRLFASYSKGPTAVVFLASDKPSEPAGLTVGTNFYEAELPVLATLLRVGQLKQIHIYTQQSADGWQGPLVFPRDLVELRIYRRYVHPMDPCRMRVPFVSDEYTQADYERWRLEPARRGTTVAFMRRIVLKWRRKKLAQSVETLARFCQWN